jgi:hypothetical protein
VAAAVVVDSADSVAGFAVADSAVDFVVVVVVEPAVLAVEIKLGMDFDLAEY